jgi:uncharacterized protein involved in outer membrane biogenesis
VNSFLLSLGVAIVLALVAALVGPYFIDWSDYRTQVEARISAMTGSDATIGGELEIRFLPTGSINISGLEIQRSDVPFPVLIVPELSAEFSLAAFLRGRIEILDVNFTQPIVSFTVHDDGSPGFGAGLGTGIDRESIAVGEFTVTDGTLVFIDESGTPLHTLSGIALSGNAETLAGPIRLDGEFDSGPVRYAFRLGTGRVQADGGVRTKLNLTSSAEAGSISLDAIVTFPDGRASVDGTVTIDRLSGEVSANSPGPAATVDQDQEFDDGSRWANVSSGPGFDIPWKLTAAISGGVESFLLRDLAVEVGAADKAISLSGTARAGLYPDPRFSAILSARQLDLDRVMGGGQAVGETVSPTDLLGKLAELAGKFVRLGFPLDLSISADGVLLGGNLIENLGTDLQIRENKIIVDRVASRLPGGTDFFLAGTFEPGPLPVADSVIRFSSENGAALAAWVGIDRSSLGPVFSRGGRTKVEFEGGVSTAPDRITIRDAVASIDGNRITGGLSYPLGNSPGDIEISLDFGSLDLDTYLPPESFARELGGSWLEGIASALLAGRDMAVRLTAEAFSSGSISADGLNVNVGVTGDVLTIHELNIASLSGASFAGRGQIDDIFDKANGSISTQMEIEDLGEFLPFLKSVFGVSSISGEMAEALSPVSIDLNLAADSSGDRTELALELNGDLAGTVFAFDGTFAGQFASFADGKFTANLTTEGVDGQKIIAQLGLGNLSGDPGPASLNFALEGRASEALAASGGLVFLGSQVTFGGSLFPGEEQTLSGNMDFTSGNIAPVIELLGIPREGSDDIPVSLRGFVVATGTGLKISTLTGQLDGSAVSGDLDLGRNGAATWFNGNIAVGEISLPWLLTLFVGEDTSTITDAADRWPATPFDLSALNHFTGNVGIKADKASLGRGIEVEMLAFDLVATEQQIRFENMRAKRGDVAIEADLNLIGEGGGQVATTFRLKLDGGDLRNYLVRPDDGVYANGSFMLSGQVSGAGRSWRGVIASLNGDGAFQVGPGDIDRLDPSAFSRLLSDADDTENPLEVTEVIVANILGNYLDEGALAHDGMDTIFSISDGILRARNAILVSDAMPLRGTLEIDIPQLALDSSWDFAPRPVQLADDNEIRNVPAVRRRIAGPLGSQSVALDVAALTGWLGVRRMEQSLAELEQARANVREQQAQEREALENIASAEPEIVPEEEATVPDAEENEAVQSANPGAVGDTPDVAGDPAPNVASIVDQPEPVLDTPAAGQQVQTAPENIPVETPAEIEVSELPDTSTPPVAIPPVGDKPLNEIVQEALREAGQTPPPADQGSPTVETPDQQTSVVPDLPPPTTLGTIGQRERQTSVVPPRGLNNEPSAPISNQRPRQPPTVQSPEGAGMMN